MSRSTYQERYMRERIADLEAANRKLEGKVGRLTARGFEDLHFENEQLRGELSDLKQRENDIQGQRLGEER